MVGLEFVIRMIASGIIFIAVMIGPAWYLTGSMDWPRGWLAIGILWGSQCLAGIWYLFKDPDLLKSRLSMRGDNPKADKLISFLIVLAMFVWIILVPVDVHAWMLLPGLPAIWSVAIGLVLLLLGLGIIHWTFMENSFASTVVEVQTERHQRVIDTGPYALVRHPMYTGMVPIFVGMGLIAGSMAMALLAIPLFVIVLLPRMAIEEATLRQKLDGYSDYMEKVRWRLVPGLY